MAGNGALSALHQWLEQRTAGAPAALQQRVLEHIAGGPSGPDRGTSEDRTEAPQLLAAAAQGALDRVVGHPGDRSVALDLLSADGLITLALLRQAEDDPEGLAGFARSLTEPGQRA